MYRIIDSYKKTIAEDYQSVFPISPDKKIVDQNMELLLITRTARSFKYYGRLVGRLISQFESTIMLSRLQVRRFMYQTVSRPREDDEFNNRFKTILGI